MDTEKKRGLTTSTLKIIAIVLMFIDHFAVVFEEQLVGAGEFGGMLQEMMRTVARIAFPLFAFMIAIGATYTKNIYKYMLRLLAFAFISEVPFDLAFNGQVFETGYQNVFFTLFLGLFCIFVYKKLREHNLEIVAFLLLLIVAYTAETLLKTDYGAMGVICIFLFYIFLQTKTPVRQLGIVLACLLISFILEFSTYLEPVMYVSGRSGNLYHADITARFNLSEFFALAAAPFALLHNGEKGKKINRWFFYAFYPAHLLLLWGAHAILFH